MDSPDQTALDQNGSRRAVAGYQPPRVERILTPAELEREVLYAGGPTAIVADETTDD